MVNSDRSPKQSDRCLMCATTCELQLQFIFHTNGQSDYRIKYWFYD